MLSMKFPGWREPIWGLQSEFHETEDDRFEIRRDPSIWMSPSGILWIILDADSGKEVFVMSEYVGHFEDKYSTLNEAMAAVERWYHMNPSQEEIVADLQEIKRDLER